MAEKPQCSTDGCENRVYCKTVCRRCYDQQRPKDLEKQRRIQKESQQRLNKDPEYREKWNKKRREYYAAQRKRVAAELRERYATDSTYREKERARVKRWREANPETKREMDRRYREENRARLRAQNNSPVALARKRQHYAELKMEVLLAYGDGSCAYVDPKTGETCGYTPDDIFELELHHVNNDGAEHRRSMIGKAQHRNYSQQFYAALREAGWPTDVPMATLCGRCHKKETLRLQREV